MSSGHFDSLLFFARLRAAAAREPPECRPRPAGMHGIITSRDSGGKRPLRGGLIDAELARLSHETDLRRASLDDAGDFRGAFVLVRVDANVRLEGGRVRDEYRLTQIAATLSAILARGGTPIVISHLGDPGAGGDSRACWKCRGGLSWRYSTGGRPALSQASWRRSCRESTQ